MFSTGRSSASLKRVDKIQEKVYNIINHKREKSESKDSSFQKQTIVNSFCASLVEQNYQKLNNVKVPNENINNMRFLPKSPISEKRC